MAKTSMEYQKVIDYILDLIKHGKLIIGSKIPSERDLAEKLEIGRNSTREAISILRGMGLIESRHGSGNYISEDIGSSIRQMLSVMISLNAISRQDILVFKKGLSQSVIEAVITNGIAEDRCERLKEIIEKMKTADRNEQIRLDFAFHKEMLESTENPLYTILFGPVAEIYMESIAETIGVVNDRTRKEFVLIHEELLKAILDQDKEKAINYSKKHYDLCSKGMSRGRVP